MQYSRFPKFIINGILNLFCDSLCLAFRYADFVGNNKYVCECRIFSIAVYAGGVFTAYGIAVCQIISRGQSPSALFRII